MRYLSLLAVALIAPVSDARGAEQFPTKPLRWLSPYAAGG